MLISPNMVLIPNMEFLFAINECRLFAMIVLLPSELQMLLHKGRRDER